MFRSGRGKPVLLGGAMGVLMLGMLHLMLTGNATLGGAALAVFVGAHVALGAVVLGFGLCAARLSPALRARLARLHRPGLGHVATMMLSAGAVALGIHLFLHSGF